MRDLGHGFLEKGGENRHFLTTDGHGFGRGIFTGGNGGSGDEKGFTRITLINTNFNDR